MRYTTLLIAFLMSFSALAADCKNKIAESEVMKAIALEPGAGAKPCGEGDTCICFDGIDWRWAKYDASKKELGIDLAKKSQVEAAEAALKSAEEQKQATIQVLIDRLKQGQPLTQEQIYQVIKRMAEKGMIK